MDCNVVCGRVLWLYVIPVLAGWVYAFVVLCSGTPGSGSGFKATPGLQDIGLSPTSRRLLNYCECITLIALRGLVRLVWNCCFSKYYRKAGYWTLRPPPSYVPGRYLDVTEKLAT